MGLKCRFQDSAQSSRRTLAIAILPGPIFSPQLLIRLSPAEMFFADFARQTRFLLEINCDRADAGFDVEIRRSGQAENRAKHFRDGVFRFGRRGDGNSPERFAFHVSSFSSSSSSKLHDYEDDGEDDFSSNHATA